jgi:DnaJ-class molecular chaperone
VQFEGVIVFLFLVLYLIGMGIKAFFRWVTGEAKREQEEQCRQENERRRQEKERERKEAAERQAKIEAKKQFEQAILNGQFPTNEVLSVLANCDDNWDDIPTNVKEAFEELLTGTCTLREISYGDAVRLIRQRGRIGERARQRAGRGGLPGDDPDRPLGEPEAFALLGVAQGCTPEELTDAYHKAVSQWHPDKLDSMAPELREYATRRTVRINEAYQLVKSTTVQNRMSRE